MNPSQRRTAPSETGGRIGAGASAHGPAPIEPGAAVHPAVFIPWLLALLLAPLLYGSVTAMGQAPVAILSGMTLLALSGRSSSRFSRSMPRSLVLAGALVLVIPLVPLPWPVVEFLHPERTRLAAAFPIPDASGPEWITLTVAPGKTIERLWEILIVIAAFSICRAGVRNGPQFASHLAFAVACAALLLAAAEVWRWADGGGWLDLRNPQAAGTFANRNHFASWLVLAALLSVGAAVRAGAPLVAARSGAVPVRSHRAALFFAVASGTAMAMVAASGSRGGAASLGAGICLWIFCLLRKSRSASRGWLVAGGAIVIFIVALSAGEHLFRRAATESSGVAFKARIWQDAAGVFVRYPAFGTGWGTFLPAFNHYKSFRGTETFWHAENDYVQAMMEGGIAGLLLLAGLAWFLARVVPFGLRNRVVEPELFLSVCAGLAAFLLHAFFEFVFQVTANAMFAGACLGFVAGIRDRGSATVVPLPGWPAAALLRRVWPVLMISGGLLQGSAYLYRIQARHAASAEAILHAMQRSVDLWPFDPERPAQLLRAKVASLMPAPQAEQQALYRAARKRHLNALRWNPLDWNLRLELAWLDMAFAPGEAALEQAKIAIRMNPLQIQTPLRFARHLQDRNPGAALECLREARPETAAQLRQLLGLAWSIEPRASNLWELTPATGEGLLSLGDFAAEKRLLPLAAEAYQRAASAIPPEVIAERLERIGHSGLKPRNQVPARN